MMIRPFQTGVAIAAVAALLLTGCSPSEPAVTPAAEQVIRVGETGTLIGDVYPSLWQNPGGISQTLVFRTLFTPMANMTDVEPDLAEDYKISDDGETITIELVDDAVWDDGEPISVDDVVWSLTSSLRAAQVKANFITAFSKIEGATAVKDGSATELSGVSADGQTVTITLTQPVSDFISVLGQFAILPKHLLEDADLLQLHNDPYWLDPVGSGMYSVGNFSPNQFIELVPSETWGGPKPTIQRVEVVQTSDPVADFEAGRIDFLFTNDVAVVDGLAAVPAAVQHPVDALFYRYFVVSAEGNTPFDNPKVREAMMYAIDRDTIVKTLYRSAATIFDTGVPAGFPGSLAEGDSLYPFDPELAKSILEDEGFDFSRTVRLRYYYEDPVSIAFMTAVAQGLTDIGLTVDVQKFQGNATAEIIDGNYDLAYAGLSALSLLEWYLDYTSLRGQSLWGDRSDYGALTAEYVRTLDSDEQVELLRELQGLEKDDLFKLPLFTIGVFIYTGAHVAGVPEALGNPFWRFDLDFENWVITE